MASECDSEAFSAFGGNLGKSWAESSLPRSDPSSPAIRTSSAVAGCVYPNISRSARFAAPGASRMAKCTLPGAASNTRAAPGCGPSARPGGLGAWADSLLDAPSASTAQQLGYQRRSGPTGWVLGAESVSRPFRIRKMKADEFPVTP